MFIKKSYKDFQIFDQWPVLLFFPINFLNLKMNQNSFWSIIINMWFRIIGNYTSEKINCKNRIDCPKCLNRNQTLFRRKRHMTAELYLVHYILGIQTTWENWTQIPKTSWDTQKILLSLQLHIQHLIRCNSCSTTLYDKSGFAIQFLIWACTLIKK